MTPPTPPASKTTPSTANRTIRIDADIAPRAALLAAAAAKMGASDAAIEQVLTAPREGRGRMSDEELVNLMVERTQERVTPVMPEPVGTAEDFARATIPMAPPKPAKGATRKKLRRA